MDDSPLSGLLGKDLLLAEPVSLSHSFKIQCLVESLFCWHQDDGCSMNAEGNCYYKASSGPSW